MQLYSKLAKWWPLISPVENYEEAAGHFVALLKKGGRTTRVLELGSGGGHNAFFLKKHFEMTLADLSPGMVEISKALNPECPHFIGDMRTLRLGQTFDAVFIQDSIGHMNTAPDLEKALKTASLHCRPGGLVLAVPDFLKETFRPGTEIGGSDSGTRSARFLEWTHDRDPDDDAYETDLVICLREEGGPVRVFHDHFTLGLFSRRAWADFMSKAGFSTAFHAFPLLEGAPAEVFPILGHKT